MSNNKFQSQLKSVGCIISEKPLVKFNIPVYQRPYIWSDLEVSKLLEDIRMAFIMQSNHYFIGNVYVSKNKSLSDAYDIIDGQQRFTTIWLIAFALKEMNIETKLSLFLANTDKELRLNFAIRTEIENYLKSILQGGTINDDVSKKEYLKGIAIGLETIKGAIRNFKSETKPETKFDLAAFGEYIYESLIFVFNVAPENTDLNRLFVTLGNSGIQLEQSDILKAQLLKQVENKVQCSKIWEACENMNDLFENNVLSIFSKTQRDNLQESNFEKFNPDVFCFEPISDEKDSLDKMKKSIDIIVQSEIIHEDLYRKEKIEQKNRCRSIIDFNLLLIHTLRILLKQKGKDDIQKPLDKKNLIEIFKEIEDKSIEEFFKLLWEVRFLFDKWIVKWRFDNDSDENSDEEEKLRLTSVYKNENLFIRQNQKHSKLSVLQSILYYTGGYNHQYWLTPFIHSLLDKQNDDEQIILSELEKIDNLMLPGEKKNISWKLTNRDERNRKIDNEILSVLEEPKGTGFSHYWFYKLEYLLWKNWENKSDDRFKNYRITSKNSVEHVFPQKHEFGSKLNSDDFDWLNSFGNLALLSVGQNSSYSNQSVVKKKDDFDNKPTYDALKLAKIYSSGDIKEWNSKKIKEHQEEMIKIIKAHYNPET